MVRAPRMISCRLRHKSYLTSGGSSFIHSYTLSWSRRSFCWCWFQRRSHQKRDQPRFQYWLQAWCRPRLSSLAYRSTYYSTEQETRSREEKTCRGYQRQTRASSSRDESTKQLLWPREFIG